MNEIEQAILTTLDDLDEKVRMIKVSPTKPDLQPLFARLDELAARLPKGSNPELQHFLQKKSYEKARLLLGGRGSENRSGSCGH